MPIEQTKTTIDHPTSTVTFKRMFSAPREAVFDAWTQPEQIGEWWDPDGVPLVECSIDLRVGGEFRLVNRGHGPPFAGIYRVIERPSLLVFDAMGAVGMVRLDGDRGVTSMMLGEAIQWQAVGVTYRYVVANPSSYACLSPERDLGIYFPVWGIPTRCPTGSDPMSSLDAYDRWRYGLDRSSYNP